MSYTKQGLFVAIDGPKNAGKTTLIRQIALCLIESGYRIHLTKEPTAQFQLSNEQKYTGSDLANLIAHDRRHHVESTVLPELMTHDAVVSDRYIASSLAFQGMDGVQFSKVWELNREFPLPDLNIFLTADATSLSRRRQMRSRSTRLEVFDPEYEIMFYDQARMQMEERGVATAIINNSDSRKEFEVVQTTVGLIEVATKDLYD